MNDPKPSEALQRYIHFYEELTPERLAAEASEIFSPEIHFKDPFNDIHGTGVVIELFERMFTQCATAHFSVLDWSERDHNAFLLWRLDYRLRRWQPSKDREIIGTSRVLFADDGRAIEHIDYWDAAHHIYEHIPVLGAILRRLKHRLG